MCQSPLLRCPLAPGSRLHRGSQQRLGPELRPAGRTPAVPGPLDGLLTQPRENQRGTFYGQLALERRQMASEPCPTLGTGSGTWERCSGRGAGPGDLAGGGAPAACGAFCFILADTCISSPQYQGTWKPSALCSAIIRTTESDDSNQKRRLLPS